MEEFEFKEGDETNEGHLYSLLSSVLSIACIHT